MADRRPKLPREGPADARETHPPFSRDRFEATPKFARFKEGMKKRLAVPKAKLDERVRERKTDSPRSDNRTRQGEREKNRARNICLCSMEIVIS
jgi:hypothetical protein